MKLAPAHPRIVRDRDNYRRFYLDENVFVTLHNGDAHVIEKGYRFNGHSLGIAKLFFSQFGNDVEAALVHDWLIDMSPWFRYTRKFQDIEYQLLMEDPLYFDSSLRRWVFPRVVRLWGYIRYDIWGDYRGKIN